MFKKVHKDHFIELKNKPAVGSIGNQKLNYQDSDKVLREMESNTSEAIKQELLRQRDFLSKKIATVSRLNKQNEQDRDDLILRVQYENTNLIKECNTLREEKKNLKEHEANIRKAFEILSKELKILNIKLDMVPEEE